MTKPDLDPRLAPEPAPLPYARATLGELLRHQAARFGERVALVHESVRITYAELERRSAAFARGLVAAGVGKGSRVALLAPNGIEWAISFFGIARAGAIAVGVNTFYKERELAWTLRHCDAQHLVCTPSFLANDYLARLEAAFPELAATRSPELALEAAPYLRRIHVWGGAERRWASDADALERNGISAAAFAALEDEVHPADLAVLIYTSGSTADPRGAVHTHGTLVRQTWNIASRMPLAPGEVLFNPSPFFWVGGLCMGLLLVLQQGATLAGQDRFEPGAALRLLQEERVTMAMAWPHFGTAMASHPDFAKTDLSALRAGNLHELMDPSLRPSRKELRTNALGMTETAGVHCMANWSFDLPERLAGAFGKPMPGVEHRVIDPETGEPAAPGALGEICVRGFTVMQGIYKAEREETFGPDGFFHTGDMGFFDDDGWLHFAGRDSDMVKTGGANVSAREVELVLAEDARVKAAYVVGLPDVTRGALVAAAVVVDEGTAIEADELRRRVRQSLAAYKVPKHVALFTAEEIPLKDSGKVDKRRLAELVAERVRRGSA